MTIKTIEKDTISFLMEVYDDYLTKHGLPEVCCREILSEGLYKTEDQRQWLVHFSKAWEAYEELTPQKDLLICGWELG